MSDQSLQRPAAVLGGISFTLYFTLDSGVSN